MYPAITFVIVTHNRRACLDRAICSIRAFCPGETEIVVVDNASTDDTWAWLQQQARIVSVRAPSNFGPGPGRNLGIAQAVGELIFFLDDDAYLDGEILGAGLDCLRADSTIGCVAYPIWEVSLQRLLYGGRPGSVKCFAAGGALFRKSVLESIGGFDEGIRWSEEFDLSVRLYAAGYRIVGLSGPLIHHHAATSTTHHSGQKLRAIAGGRLRSFMTHFRWPAAMIFSGRMLLSVGWVGLKGGHFWPVPLAVWDIFRSWSAIRRRRVVVPKNVQELFFRPDPAEDEFSVPITSKVMRRLFKDQKL